MTKRKLLAAAIASLFSLGLGIATGAPIDNRATDVVGAGVSSEPLVAIEANRVAIVERIMSDHAQEIASRGLDSRAFGSSLLRLRADQLLAASLVADVEDIIAIVAQPVVDGVALLRYQPIAPVQASAAMSVAGARAYLVRDGESMSVVRAADLGSLRSGIEVVGYFSPNPAADGSNTGFVPTLGAKDGTGSGSGSWIGFVTGGNQATGPSSAVAAGTSNLASGQGAFVGAGTANQANGISSLVIGGFDNRATAIDSIVGAGAGNRATGARSIVVGGGYNIASGQFSFVGGGGRDGVASTPAGTDAKDNQALGNFSAVVGGQGNKAGTVSAALAGIVAGHRNTASGANSFIGGGGCNVASNTGALVLGGGQESSTAPCSFGNTASGYYSAIGGGYANTASGTVAVIPGGESNTASALLSFAAGYQANAAHQGAFVWSDSTGGGASTGANQFVVKAADGIRLTSPKGVALDAFDGAIITRGWDAFDGTAPSEKQGLGRWGLFMEPSNLTIGIPGVDAGVRGFQVATYGINGVASPVVTINQSGMITQPSAFGQNLTFLGANKGFGSQPNVVYARAGSGMYWFAGGIHSDTTADPGTGGVVLASLTNGPSATAVVGTFRAQVVTATSDRNAKTAFAMLDPKSILAKVAALPVTTWSYKNEAGQNVRHIGPVSQDFRRLFGVGYDDKSIATVDADGVALAAIKGLKQIVDEKDAKISRLEKELALIKAKLGIR